MVKRTKIFIYTSVYLVLFDAEAVQITSAPVYLSNYWYCRILHLLSKRIYIFFTVFIDLTFLIETTSYYIKSDLHSHIGVNMIFCKFLEKVIYSSVSTILIQI